MRGDNTIKMKKAAATLMLCATMLASTLLASGYKAEAAGAPPSELAAPIAAELNPAGYKVVKPDGKVWCELWFRKSAPKGPESAESDMMWKTAPLGSLIGAIRFPEAGLDRRAQAIKPGVYTLRFQLFPINGDHQGVAPNRDFLLLTPAADDQSIEAVPKFDDLVKMSKKTSGTPHPAVLSMWLITDDPKPGTMMESGENEWALQAKIGETNIAVIVVGAAE
jgi:hypothetical protein